MTPKTLGAFEHVRPHDYDQEVLTWLKVIPGVPKLDFKLMLSKLDEEEWHLWKIPKPGSGIVVSYEEDGLLFVYYLHGKRFFPRVTVKDLLIVINEAEVEGLRCWVSRSSVRKLLEKLGFKHVNDVDQFQVMELRHGRRK